jgi:hypothetical protein
MSAQPVQVPVYFIFIKKCVSEGRRHRYCRKAVPESRSGCDWVNRVGSRKKCSPKREREKRKFMFLRVFWRAGVLKRIESGFNWISGSRSGSRSRQAKTVPKKGDWEREKKETHVFWSPDADWILIQLGQ